MADPISIVGVVAIALHAIHEAADFVESIHGAPRVVEALSTDLKAIAIPLRDLARVLDTPQSFDAATHDLLEGCLRSAISNCQNIARDVQEFLRPFIKKSNNTPNTNIWKRFVLSFREEKVAGLQKELESRKNSLNVAATSAIILIQRGQSKQAGKIDRGVRRIQRHFNIETSSIASSEYSTLHDASYRRDIKQWISETETVAEEEPETEPGSHPNEDHETFFECSEGQQPARQTAPEENRFETIQPRVKTATLTTRREKQRSALEKERVTFAIERERTTSKPQIAASAPKIQESRQDVPTAQSIPAIVPAQKTNVDGGSSFLAGLFRWSPKPVNVVQNSTYSREKTQPPKQGNQPAVSAPSPARDFEVPTSTTSLQGGYIISKSVVSREALAKLDIAVAREYSTNVHLKNSIDADTLFRVADLSKRLCPDSSSWWSAPTTQTYSAPKPSLPTPRKRTPVAEKPDPNPAPQLQKTESFFPWSSNQLISKDKVSRQALRLHEIRFDDKGDKVQISGRVDEDTLYRLEDLSRRLSPDQRKWW